MIKIKYVIVVGLLSLCTLLCFIATFSNVYIENKKQDQWYDSLNKIDALVQSIELSTVEGGKYYYVIEIKYKFNSIDYTEKIVESSTKEIFPYKVNDIYEIRVDDNNEIFDFTDYDKNIAKRFVFLFTSIGLAVVTVCVAFSFMDRYK